MGIVVITIPGTDKEAFVNELHQKTNGGIDLVVIQRKPLLSRGTRLRRFIAETPLTALPRELYYAARLRLTPDVRVALGYFRGDQPHSASPLLPPTLEVPSVNNDDVVAKLHALAPDLLVVWGSTILQPPLLATAKQAINLHFGHCPYYRGAMANQLAVLHDERDKIGATIHHINERADAGDIIQVITPPNAAATPKILFQELKADASSAFVAAAAALLAGDTLPATPQDITVSRNGTLRSWTPSVRYTVGKKVLAWEKAVTLEKP